MHVQALATSLVFWNCLIFHIFLKTNIVLIRKPPLPLRERVGVRGIKMEVIEILTPHHPHPPLPRRRGREKVEFPWTLT